MCKVKQAPLRASHRMGTRKRNWFLKRNGRNVSQIEKNWLSSWRTNCYDLISPFARRYCETSHASTQTLNLSRNLSLPIGVNLLLYVICLFCCSRFVPRISIVKVTGSFLTSFFNRFLLGTFLQQRFSKRTGMPITSSHSLHRWELGMGTRNGN